jgi:multidrug resistance efflux pump
VKQHIKKAGMLVTKHPMKIGGGLLSTVLFILYLLSYSTTSKEAFINARVARVLSPAPGILSISNEIKPGFPVAAQQTLGTILATAANNQIIQLTAQCNALDIQIAGLEKQITGLDKRLTAYRGQQAQYSAESTMQRNLERLQTKATLVQLQSELKAIREKNRFTSSQLQGYENLYKKHYISRIKYEKLRSEAVVLKADQDAKAAELQQRLLDSDAATSGLQLTGARTLDAPQQNQRDLTLTIEDMTQDRLQLVAQLNAAQASREAVKAQLGTQELATFHSTFDGVVWSIDTENGAGVQTGSPVMQVMDCNVRWVEAFFDESQAGKVKPGVSVNVRLSSAPLTTWQGKVRTVRAGTGRVSVGESVVMPPPEIARRQLPVKVVTAWIDVNWSSSPDPQTFCMAGRSVTVSF